MLCPQTLAYDQQHRSNPLDPLTNRSPSLRFLEKHMEHEQIKIGWKMRTCEANMFRLRIGRMCFAFDFVAPIKSIKFTPPVFAGLKQRSTGPNAAQHRCINSLEVLNFGGTTKNMWSWGII